MEIIAVINQKGGVGKTTTTHALGTGLKKKGFRVLFVDLEAQGNLSFTLGAKAGATIADLLQYSITEDEGFQIQNPIQRTPYGDLIPSSQTIVGADTLLADVKGKEFLLRDILEPLKKHYDYILIDTSPTLGTLTINALAAATMIIAPMQADGFSLQSLSQLYGTITAVRKQLNPKLVFKGILLTRFNSRTVISREIAEKIGQAAAGYGTKLFKTTIAECTAIKEAQLMRQSIFDYAPKSRAAKEYSALLEELLEA